ncbi:anti-sigma factor [Flexivirga sp. ID2601S]|uniref:Regulator of SigK n=1 Tax=Flexivirga aerilata TaxID=1656889 RepID=A0A849AIP4_9MICO|nr:anti-sigma factor [Flexivirga aerilata]NNG39118.1 anti-sigma factor [Flexivirga aerilata]
MTEDMHDKHIDTLDYALDAMDEVSRRWADRHLEHCAQCRAEVAELQEATAALGESTAPVSPPPALRDSVLSAVAQTPQTQTPQTPAPPSPAPHAETPADRTSQATTVSASRRRNHPARWLLAAAAAVLLIAGGVTLVAQPWQQDKAPVSAVQQVEQAPDARSTTVSADGGSLVVVTSAQRGKAVATLRGMPPAPAGKAYQAWFIAGGKPVSAGLLTPGTATVLDGSVSGASAAAVTVEPAGGSQQPTSKPLMTVALA